MSNCFLHSVYNVYVCVTNSILLRASPRAPLNTFLIVFFLAKRKKAGPQQFVSEICKDKHILNDLSDSQKCACIPPIFPLAAIVGGWHLTGCWTACSLLGGAGLLRLAGWQRR